MIMMSPCIKLLSMITMMLQILPGLDFMIGGKDTCQGDSGGPLWVREDIEGAPIAYLVSFLMWLLKLTQLAPFYPCVSCCGC